MSRATWFDAYCERFGVMWRRRNGYFSVVYGPDTDFEEKKFFRPGSRKSKYDLGGQEHGTYIIESALSEKVSLHNKAVILHTRYDVASSVLLEQVENMQTKSRRGLDESSITSVMDSLFGYFLNIGVLDRAKFKEMLDNGPLVFGNYSMESRIKALDSGLYGYMKGLYDSWIKEKERWGRGSEKLKMCEIDTFRRAYDRATSHESEINNLLKDVANFDCTEPLIHTQRYRRRGQKAVASAVSYMKNIGILDKKTETPQLGHGLAATLKGSVDKWIEAETLRNINELYT